jgi:amino acid transporter
MIAQSVAIVLADVLLAWHGASATDFLASPWRSGFGFDTAILWGTIVFALSGSESVAFLRNDIHGDTRTIARALAALGIVMVLIYMAGTASMLVILPEAALTRLSGLPDALHAALARVGYPAQFVSGIRIDSTLGKGTAIHIYLPRSGILNKISSCVLRRNCPGKVQRGTSRLFCR